jgi:hypothetical protein
MGPVNITEVHTLATASLIISDFKTVISQNIAMQICQSGTKQNAENILNYQKRKFVTWPPVIRRHYNDMEVLTITHKNNRCVKMSPVNIHTISASKHRVQYVFNGKVALTHL